MAQESFSFRNIISPKQSAFFLLVALFVSSQIPVVKSSTDGDVMYAPILGNATYPEGIHLLPDGSFLIGGFGDGSIQKVTFDKDGTKTSASYYSGIGENGMSSAVGFATDLSRDRLWVANFNFDTGNGIPGSQVKVFTLSTGELTATIPEEYLQGVFFNELAIDKAGNVYITDTLNPQIWKAKVDLSGVDVFVKDDLLSNPAPDQPFDLNGLAITNNEKYLIASVMDRLDAGDGRLVRIEIDTKEVSPVTLLGTEDAVAAFAGSDGMFFYTDDLLFMVNVFSSAGAIFTAKFNKDYSASMLVIRDAYQDYYVRPTASATRKEMLWTVQSQLDHIIDDKNGNLGTPPKLPFQIIGVPLDKTLEDDYVKKGKKDKGSSTSGKISKNGKKTRGKKNDDGP
jgi:sugar lactone lactonase YvrE